MEGWSPDCRLLAYVHAPLHTLPGDAVVPSRTIQGDMYPTVSAEMSAARVENVLSAWKPFSGGANDQNDSFPRCDGTTGPPCTYSGSTHIHKDNASIERDINEASVQVRVVSGCCSFLVQLYGEDPHGSRCFFALLFSRKFARHAVRAGFGRDMLCAVNEPPILTVGLEATYRKCPSCAVFTRHPFRMVFPETLVHSTSV